MATFTTTAKYALRWLTGSNLISDIDAGFQALAEDIDGSMAGYTSGTLASLPAAGKAGRIYRATDARAILLDTGTAWVDLVPQRVVTSLPGTPYDGQVIHYVADATNGVLWPLRYNASGGTYKWEAVGPMPLSAEVATAETRSSAAFGDLTTVGPSVVVPLAGEYEIASSLYADVGGGTGSTLSMALTGTSASADPEMQGSFWVPTATASGTQRSTIGRSGRRTVTPAGTTVKLQYASDGTHSATFGRRTLLIRPFRVG
jgi:hypothetical protein